LIWMALKLSYHISKLGCIEVISNRRMRGRGMRGLARSGSLCRLRKVDIENGVFVFHGKRC